MVFLTPERLAEMHRPLACIGYAGHVSLTSPPLAIACAGRTEIPSVLRVSDRRHARADDPRQRDYAGSPKRSKSNSHCLPFTG